MISKALTPQVKLPTSCLLPIGSQTCCFLPIKKFQKPKKVEQFLVKTENCMTKNKLIRIPIKHGQLRGNNELIPFKIAARNKAR